MQSVGFSVNRENAWAKALRRGTQEAFHNFRVLEQGGVLETVLSKSAPR